MMNPEGMTKREIIKALLDDFIARTPDWTKCQHRDLWMRLNWLEDDDLKDLVENIKPTLTTRGNPYDTT